MDEIGFSPEEENRCKNVLQTGERLLLVVKPRVEMDVVDTWFRRISGRIVLGIWFLVQDAQFEKSAVRTTATVVSVRQEVRKHTDNHHRRHRSYGGHTIHVGGNHVSPHRACRYATLQFRARTGDDFHLYRSFRFHHRRRCPGGGLMMKKS